MAAGDSPIRFVFQPIDFKLDSDETPERHAPETMAGGVAIFDFNNDGKLDIFFANGADIKTLHKTSAKYYNRLFQNDGQGHFTDVTEKAGLFGTGYDIGVAIGDYDNDGYEDIFVAGVIAIRSITTMGMGPSPMSPPKPASTHPIRSTAGFGPSPGPGST